MKHTQGEWTLHEPTGTDKRVLVLHPDGERVIADAGIGYFSSRGSIPLAERKANARLMVAAPNLLEKLREATDLLVGAAAWLESSGQPMVAKGLREWVSEKAKPIIAKAGGE